ncbi:MAG: PilZ domain-containing protein [Polyangiaceae bacterium]
MSAILARKMHRRAFRRGVFVSCEVVREHDFRRIARVGIDLSTEGMLVKADRGVLTGEELFVAFRAPYGRWFDVRATVARVIHGRRPGDVGPCLGLEFFDHDDEWKSALFEHIRGWPGRPPSRIAA